MAVVDRLRTFAAKMAATDAFVKVGPHVVPPVDRVLFRATGGRFTLGSIIVPSLVLTNKGAKSGIDRETPLATLPDEDHWYVVGSNFGRTHHPAWTYNLMAHPDATVRFGGRTTLVTATKLDEEQKAQVWPRLVERWPNYDRYMLTAGGRELRVFRLDPR